MKYVIRPLSWIVLPEGEPIFSKHATIIKIEDHAAGPFLDITQPGNESEVISIDKQSWPRIRMAIEEALGMCAQLEQEVPK